MKKVALFLFCLLIIFIAYQFLRTRHLIKVGEGISKAAIPFETKKDNATMHILIVGDSTAVGVGAMENTKSIAGLTSKKYPYATIENLGENGAKLKDIIENIESAKRQTYDIIILQAGANDIVRFTENKIIKQELKTLLKKATQLSENVIIFHSGNIGASPLFPYGTRWLWTKKTREVREIYKEIVPQYKAHYVDLYIEKNKDPYFLEPSIYFAKDLFHPSSEGYMVWWQQIEAVLNQNDN